LKSVEPWRPLAVALGLTLVASAAVACSAGSGQQDRGSHSPSPTTTSPRAAAPPVQPLDKTVTLRILGSNDLKDMEEVVAEASRATNVKVEISYVGSPVGAQMVATGQTDGKFDALWFASNAYLPLQPGAIDKVATSTKIMTSPVSIGLDSDVAKRLGWDHKSPTWAQIARAASAKKFTFGMSDPSVSNAAFSSLANIAAALSGGGEVLKTSEVDAVAPQLRQFFAAQKMTAESASDLADKFLAQAGKPGSPDGIVNYESKLIALNASGKLAKPLTVVIPADGVISADFPFALLNGANPDTKSAYAVLLDWLRSPAGQQMIMDKTNRRPAAPGVKPDPKFGDRVLVELPFPGQRAVLDRLLTSYLNSIRRATQSIYVLDLSGSMKGERIRALRTALVSLAGGSGSISSSGYAIFRQRERVTIIGYSSRVRTPKVFTISAKDPKKDLARIRVAARQLESDNGNTATYSALREAYRVADRQVASNPGALTSVVLMTDGETNRGITSGQFSAFYRKLPQAAQTVPTFAVKVGPADAKALGHLAGRTGGRVFTATGTRLAKPFREIRAYQ
jgi:Ca-activated chloride channel homolog